MKEKSILIVFSDKKLAEITFNKINLLRSNDEATFVSYDEFNNIEDKIQPSIIILCHNNTQELSIIDNIKATFKNTPVILVTENLCEDTIIEAYEKEIDDFFSINDSDAIILMRILNALKKNKLQEKLDINNKILIAENYIDQTTNIFKKDSAKNVLSTIFNSILNEQTENNVFLHLKLLKEENPTINIKNIGKTLKKTLRETDLIVFGENNTFSIILKNINEEQTINLINKINKNLKNKFLIYYTATKITKSYENTIKIVEPLINIQIEDKEYFIFINDVEQAELTELIQVHNKKENNSKQEFIKRIENIVAPVYYQTQTKYSERLKKAEINYCINNSENIFSIKKDEIKNELSITYPTLDNIIVDIIEYSSNNIIKERKIIYHTNDFTEEKLTEEIENMIKDFIEADSINTINKETYETK